MNIADVMALAIWLHEGAKLLYKEFKDYLFPHERRISHDSHTVDASVENTT